MRGMWGTMRGEGWGGVGPEGGAEMKDSVTGRDLTEWRLCDLLRAAHSSFRGDWTTENLPSFTIRAVPPVEPAAFRSFSMPHLGSYLLARNNHEFGTIFAGEIHEDINMAIRMESAVSFAQRPCGSTLCVCFHLHRPCLEATLIRDEQIGSPSASGGGRNDEAKAR